MVETGSPERPEFEGQHVLSKEELSTGDHAKVPVEMVRDAVELTDPAELLSGQSVAHTIEKLGLEAHVAMYEESPEACVETLRRLQRELELKGSHELTKPELSDRAVDAYEALGAGDQEILRGCFFGPSGALPLEGPQAAERVAAEFNSSNAAGALRQARKSVRRFAIQLN